ncbi:nucleotide pyrophosphohydrolase [Peloplasma aerotolerans]|uniref:Nucleotide pyrophosphohydrolase n=1 Tax=Peloplasma aerotolerans TaxID=3044389 RepID=A0AAW6U6N5_9MOLU|nr:nucleotide pyrophosphohydrolase [Mariniplasma sp. M4Ah]MDI6453542.1 nucleotide pyrophosphohydrolase [Mariniplasma sp. M4Ah]
MKEIIDQLIKFRDDRNWKQFHTPENLSKSIVLEAAELLENYQWGTMNENKENIKEEIADIVAYCLLLCDCYGFDIKDILKEKIEKNEVKYPIEKSYGKSNKYNKI